MSKFQETISEMVSESKRRNLVHPYRRILLILVMAAAVVVAIVFSTGSSLSYFGLTLVSAGFLINVSSFSMDYSNTRRRISL